MAPFLNNEILSIQETPSPEHIELGQRLSKQLYAAKKAGILSTFSAFMRENSRRRRQVFVVVDDKRKVETTVVGKREQKFISET